MTLKKKLVVSTLAASMVAASVAGLPLSSKGLANQLGLSNVAAAATSNSSADLKARAEKLYAQITKESDKATLRALRDEVSALTSAELKEIFTPLRGKLDLSTTQEDTVFALFQDVSSLYYDPEYTDAKDILNNQEYIDVLKVIAEKGGVSSLTVDDIYAAVFGDNGLEKKLVALVSGKTKEQLLELVTSSTVQDELVNSAIDAVLSQTAGPDALKISTVLNNLSISSADVKTVLNNSRAKLTNDKAALQVLAIAYIGAFGLGVTPTPTPTPSPTPSSGSGPDGTTITLTPDQAFNAASKYDASKLVVTIGDKATVKLVDADINKAFDTLVAAAKAAGKTGALTLTLDLGTVKAATVEVPLSKAIVEAAKSKGIANIAITFNGVTVTIPVSQFSTAIALTVTTAKPEVVTSVTQLKLASDVYEFGLSVDGVATSRFSTPIPIEIPVNNTDGIDTELLSLAKIINGKLEFHGGRLNGKSLVESRDTFSSYAVLENRVTFTDIASVQAWAGRQIQVVAAKGAIEGVGEDKFAPKSNVTRAEFAKMLIRALDLENHSAVQSFSDVSGAAWYAPYVAVAAEKGIITGRSADKFDPNATITRAEMATMISRAVKSMNPAATTNVTAISQFSDAAKISASLRDGVAFAADHNLVIGNAGKFNPNDTATRAEAAVIIYRTINFK
ncbi:S-layer homology domain-containing protein [Paenibacillus sp. RS8]|uniref:S-layer homology domain-containing protein n=1 Tax=Paenibacillus sp. RS8 TaxID=3242681 RepID=UPI0035C20246